MNILSTNIYINTYNKISYGKVLYKILGWKKRYDKFISEKNFNFFLFLFINLIKFEKSNNLINLMCININIFGIFKNHKDWMKY